MAEYAVGQQIKLSGFFSLASSGAGTDPTTITVKVKTPAGVTTTWVYGVDSQVVKSGTGDYYANWTITESGTHWYEWNGTGAVIAATEKSFIATTSNV